MSTFRLGRLAGPLDVRQSLDIGMKRMHEFVLFVQTSAEFRADALQVTCGKIRHIAIVFLRFDNRIEIAAIGNIDLDGANIRTIDFDIGFVQE